MEASFNEGQDSYGVAKPVIIIVIVIVTARLITRAASLLHALRVTWMSAQANFSIQFVSKLSTVY